MKWKKVKVGDFLIRVKDLIPIEKNKEYNLVTIKLYHKGVQLRKTESGSKISADRMSKVKAGQFILSGIDARNGAFGIIPKELDGAVVTNDFWHFDINENIISKEYFLWLTSTPFFDDICKKASDGTTNRIRLQADRFYCQELTIPEIEDQHYVVKGLKKQSNKIELLRSEYQIQLSLLENLNQAILQEAVQGKLVSQAPNDETASELLNRIKAKKAKLGKKEKPLSPIKPEEIPFPIPKNWVWCRLGGAGNLKRGKSKHRPRNDKRLFVNGKFPFIQTGDVAKAKNNNDLITTINDYYNEFGLAQSEMQSKGTLCITIAANIAECGFLGFDACAPDSIVCFQSIDKSIEVFVYYFLKLAKADLERYAPATAQKNINLGILNDLPIPIPPLSEQKRIIAEIEKQLVKTRQLKEHILANQKVTEQLLKVLLQQVFEVKEMKELVAKPIAKVIKSKPNTVKWDNLEAEPYEKYAAHPVNNIQNIDWEMALMVACMKKKLGVTYGDVGLQKNVFNTNNLQPIFSKQYGFINSNFGTYSYELKEDLKKNPYLTSQKVANNKEVYVVNSKYSKQVLDKISAPENKEFVKAISDMLSIYEHPLINKETDKIELYNTVLKVALDKNTTNIEVIYKGMKDWKIKQAGYKTKAEKFSRADSEKILKLLMAKKIF